MSSIVQQPIAILIAAWGVSAGVGLAVMLNDEFTPAPTAAVAPEWPEASKLVRSSVQPTLTLFLHPHCPCSRATLRELGVLAEDCEAKFALRVVFVSPRGAGEGWERSDLYRSAQQNPAAALAWDADGAEAKRFGATTSGEALLYAADGRLLFHGGLTPSRGHEGDNLGRAALTSLILTGGAACTRTAVFGCPLTNRPDSGP